MYSVVSSHGLLGVSDSDLIDKDTRAQGRRMALEEKKERWKEGA